MCQPARLYRSWEDGDGVRVRGGKGYWVVGGATLIASSQFGVVPAGGVLATVLLDIAMPSVEGVAGWSRYSLHTLDVVAARHVCYNAGIQSAYDTLYLQSLNVLNCVRHGLTTHGSGGS